MDLSKKLKELRIEAKISQSELARRAGISQSYYNEIESGKPKVKCPIETLNAICEALNVSLSEFFAEETEDTEIPDELKKYDVELIKVLKNHKLTPEETKRLIKVVKALYADENNRD